MISARSIDMSKEATKLGQWSCSPFEWLPLREAANFARSFGRVRSRSQDLEIFVIDAKIPKQRLYFPRDKHIWMRKILIPSTENLYEHKAIERRRAFIKIEIRYDTSEMSTSDRLGQGDTISIPIPKHHSYCLMYRRTKARQRECEEKTGHV